MLSRIRDLQPQKRMPPPLPSPREPVPPRARFTNMQWRATDSVQNDDKSQLIPRTEYIKQMNGHKEEEELSATKSPDESSALARNGESSLIGRTTQTAPGVMSTIYDPTRDPRLSFNRPHSTLSKQEPSDISTPVERNSTEIQAASVNETEVEMEGISNHVSSQATPLLRSSAAEDDNLLQKGAFVDKRGLPIKIALHGMGQQTSSLDMLIVSLSLRIRYMSLQLIRFQRIGGGHVSPVSIATVIVVPKLSPEDLKDINNQSASIVSDDWIYASLDSGIPIKLQPFKIELDHLKLSEAGKTEKKPPTISQLLGLNLPRRIPLATKSTGDANTTLISVAEETKNHIISFGGSKREDDERRGAKRQKHDHKEVIPKRRKDSTSVHPDDEDDFEYLIKMMK